MDEKSEMKKKNKEKEKSPPFINTIKILLAGAALVTIGAVVKKGIQIQDYPPKDDNTVYSTILVYMDGSNLESDYYAATDDLHEMEQALRDSGLTNEDVHIVVEAGGAKRWVYDAMADKKYGRFCVSAEGSYNVEGMEARDMGESDTLADFINYGTQSYPAENYGLVFWNHGSGQIDGFGCDEQFEESSLTLQEIEEGFQKSHMKQPFSFISMDACLMGDIELASVLKSYARYLIASEEVEPQQGYDYSWMKTIYDEMHKTQEDLGEAIGESMVRTYKNYYKDKDYKLTLTLMDLAAYDGFHEQFHKMMDQVADGANDNFYRNLGKKRLALQGFNRSGSEAAEIIDMMSFLKLLAGLTGKTAEYAELQNQYKKLVICKIVKGYVKSPSGVSIYLPSGADEWMLKDLTVYNNIDFCTSYKNFLDKYKNYLKKESHIQWFDVDGDQKEIKVRVNPDSIEEIAAAYLTTFIQPDKGGPAYLLSTDSDLIINRSGYLKAEPDKQYWGIKDKFLCMIEVINNSAYTEYLAPVLYRSKSGRYQLCTIHIQFDDDHEDGKVVAITPVGGKKQQYELKEGDTFYPLYPLKEKYEDDMAGIKKDENQAMQNGQTEEEIRSGSIYMDSYYIGDRVSIDSMEDGKLMLIDAKIEDCIFGFMLQDTKQRLSCTDFISGKEM